MSFLTIFGAWIIDLSLGWHLGVPRVGVTYPRKLESDRTFGRFRFYRCVFCPILPTCRWAIKGKDFLGNDEDVATFTWFSFFLLGAKKSVPQKNIWFQNKISKTFKESGQIIATSHDLTPNGGLVREIPLFQGNPGWWIIVVWPQEWKSRNPLSHKIPMICCMQTLPRTLRIRTAIHRALSPPKILGFQRRRFGSILWDFMGISTQELGEFNPRVGEFNPKVGEFNPKVGEFNPKVGEDFSFWLNHYTKTYVSGLKPPASGIWPQLKKYSQLLRAELEQFWTSCLIVFYFVPGTQMTLVFIRKGLVLEGWRPKIEDKQVQVH